MPSSEKDLLAAEVMDRWLQFQKALSSEKRKYPIRQFQAFWSVAKRYAELTNIDCLLHKSVASAVHGLVETSSVRNVRGFQAMFFAMQSG